MYIYIYFLNEKIGRWLEGYKKKNYKNFIEKNILLLNQRHGKYSQDITKSYIELELFAAFRGKVACSPI